LDACVPANASWGTAMKRAGWMAIAILLAAATTLAVHELFDPGRPLSVRFWTAVMIGAGSLTVLAVQRAVAGRQSQRPGVGQASAPDRDAPG
jgi:hypothetical protein